MPKGLTRYYGAKDLHFITSSCYQRKPWPDTDERCDLFLGILEEMRKEHRLVVPGYVVIPGALSLAHQRAAGGNTVDGAAKYAK
jgi:putative transposase